MESTDPANSATRLFAVTTYSIRPGGTPAVKQRLAQAMQSPPLASAAAVTLATELGEVNTITCLWACTDVGPDLQALQRWNAAISCGEVAALLRSVTTELFSGSADAAQLRALAAPGVAAVLLQEFSAFDGPCAPQQVRFTSHTGRHGHDWLLTPLPTPDAALQLSLQSMKAPAGDLQCSRLLLPIR